MSGNTVLLCLGAMLATATPQKGRYTFHPYAELKRIELSYTELSSTCRNAHPITGDVAVTSVTECEQKCDAQAAAAPGTGQAACIAVDTNGKDCYLKSQCSGTPGQCSPGSMCGYRRNGAPPGPTPVPPAPPIPPAPPGMTLREAAQKRGIFIGAATNVAGLDNTTEPLYKSVEQSQFSITTAENACKWGPIHPERSTYDFTGCDIVFNNSRDANQTFRGHNLCWHTENPGWLTNGHFNASELTALLQEHIQTVAGRYGTGAYAWDVVNEALDNNGLKPSVPWYPAVPDYIDVAFKAARAAAGPSVKLFYNDYSAEGMNAKSDQMYKLVKNMQERNIPIDGVGLQFHWDLVNHPSLSDVSANMKRFAELGLEIHITELDIKCTPEGSGKPCTPDLLNAQAALYADIMRTCLSVPQCKSFETWGFTDKHSWLGAATAPLLFDTDYKPKPAVAALINAMLNTSAVLVH